MAQITLTIPNAALALITASLPLVPTTSEAQGPVRRQTVEEFLFASLLQLVRDREEVAAGAAAIEGVRSQLRTLFGPAP